MRKSPLLRDSRGFTLVELMVTIAILAIFAAVAVPQFNTFIDKQRLVGGVDSVVDQLQFARTEAVKRSGNTVVTITDGAAWFVGTSTGAAACANAADCLRSVSSQTCRTCSMASTSAGTITYTRRGLPTPAAAVTIVMQSGLGRQVQITVSPLGMVSTCTPAAAQLGGYPVC